MTRFAQFMVLLLCAPALSYTNSLDKLNLSGTYKCYGYDKHDGAYENAVATVTLDSDNSDFSHNFGSYHFKLADPDGTVYLGEMAASGNQAAIYFANTSPKMNTDNGVGIATITHDQDTNGKFSTVIHKFYYEPNYQGGGNGSETCIKTR